MTNQVLFRLDNSNRDEYNIACKYFNVVTNRTSLIKGRSLVIPRYSALPYYLELTQDLDNLNCTPINSYQDHKWIANFEYYQVMLGHTFKSYTDNDFYLAPEGSYVVKGRTNSRKFQWNKLMFAKNKRQASEIASDLLQDSLIQSQGIIYRKYEQLEILETGINGLDFTNEWRFFFYKENLLTYGYYWSIAENIPTLPPVGMIEFAKNLGIIASGYTNFFVLDVARKANGDFVLVEINDGMMSGLSECNPDELYSNLKLYLEKEG